MDQRVGNRLNQLEGHRVLAYLILVHKSPRQLARLVEALQHPRVAFFVHVDDMAEEAQFRYMLRTHENLYFVRPRHVVEWGGWKMVEAELTLLRSALAAGAEHMILLSGSDYPVWSNDRLVKQVYMLLLISVYIIIGRLIVG